MTNLARLRTLDEAFAEIKKADPNTCISKYHLRRIFLSGAVPTVTCGRKRLVNFDALLDYLSGNHTAEHTPDIAALGGIRKIM